MSLTRRDAQAVAHEARRRVETTTELLRRERRKGEPSTFLLLEYTKTLFNTYETLFLLEGSEDYKNRMEEYNQAKCRLAIQLQQERGADNGS